MENKNFDYQTSLDCPVKLAEKFFKDCSQESVDKFCNLIGFRQDNPKVLDWIAYYLSKSCQCFRNTHAATDKIVLTCIANVFLSLGLDITPFENYILYFGDFNHDSFPEEIDKIWEKAKEMQIGSTCQLCCGKNIVSASNLAKNCCTKAF